MLQVHDPRDSAGIVTVDTRSALKVGGQSSWNSQDIFSKPSARMMSSYCTGASTRTNPVHHQFSCFDAVSAGNAKKDRARIFVEGTCQYSIVIGGERCPRRKNSAKP